MRCPFRVAGFDLQPECDPECAWRMEDTSAHGLGDACAIAVIAENTGDEFNGYVAKHREEDHGEQ